jgi:membrane associated rhomboid family serine protease
MWVKVRWFDEETAARTLPEERGSLRQLAARGCPFVIVPFTHTDVLSRRWPWATTLLVALNVCAFFGTRILGKDDEEAARQAVVAIAAYFHDHPDVQLPKTLGGVQLVRPPAHASPPILVTRTSVRCDGRSPQACAAAQAAANRELAGQVPTPAVIARAQSAAQEAADAFVEQPSEVDQATQAEFDALVADYETKVAQVPSHRYGYIPAAPTVLALVTSQFMHASIPHLLFNMWFMWLCACNLEDRWGRLVFVPFYLVAGVVAALVHAHFAPDSMLPLVGASGAVAGAMGAFLVTHGAVHIRFFYTFIWIPPIGTFTARAWLALLIWVLGELVGAGLMPAGMGGTAHWAHVGGFAFGLAFAIVLRATGIEKRLDALVEKSITVYDADADDEAAKGQGARPPSREAAQALERLDQAATAAPHDVPTHEQLLRIAREAGDARREARATAKLAELYLMYERVDSAAALFFEAHAKGHAALVPRPARMLLAQHLAGRGAADAERAAFVYETVLAGGFIDAAAVRAAVEIARFALSRGQAARASSLLGVARSSPDASPELLAEIESLGAQSAGEASGL